MHHTRAATVLEMEKIFVGVDVCVHCVCVQLLMYKFVFRFNLVCCFRACVGVYVVRYLEIVVQLSCCQFAGSLQNCISLLLWKLCECCFIQNEECGNPQTEDELIWFSSFHFFLLFTSLLCLRGLCEVLFSQGQKNPTQTNTNTKPQTTTSEETNVQQTKKARTYGSECLRNFREFFLDHHCLDFVAALLHDVCDALER